MKKLRLKRWMSVVLVVFMLISGVLPAFAFDETSNATRSTSNNECYDFSSLSHYHTFDDGIVDGGIYSLRNVSTGNYMDVDNWSTVDGTSVITYSYHGGTNQRFQFRYLGKGIYEIKPIYADIRLHLDGNNLVIHSKYRGMNQKFKLVFVGPMTAVILSEVSGYTKALGVSGTSVQQMTYPPLINAGKAQWVLEGADTSSADLYESFHIQNANTKLYLDVTGSASAPGTIVQGYPETNAANQEWKFAPHQSGGYYLKPMNRNDMALSYVISTMTIQNDDAINHLEQFYIYAYTTQTSTGRTMYRIGILTNTGIQYLTMRTRIDDTRYYVEFAPDATDLWFIEPVAVDAKEPQPLTLNNSTSGTVTTSYNNLQYYTYRPTQDARYKIEFSGSYCFVEYPVSNVGSGVLDQYTYDSKTIIDVFLQAGIVYYIPIRYAGYAGGPNGSLSVRVRQLTFAGHSCGDDINAHDDIDVIEPYVIGTMDFYGVHRTNLSASTALNATMPFTGYQDFNSEIFVYSGHGGDGYAAYLATLKQDALAPTQLPNNMSNCELAVWDCCYSAISTEGGTSLVTQSVANGATAAIGWSQFIYSTHSVAFMELLFNKIAQGATVYQATQYALSGTYYDEFDYQLTIIDNFASDGNLNHIIFPKPTNASATQSVPTQVLETAQAWNRSDYTLVADNSYIGVRLYTRMVSGVPSDDYFLEFYDENGSVTEIRKSDYTMTNDDLQLASAQIQQAAAMKAQSTVTSANESVEYQIQYVNGAWQLVEKIVTQSEDCGCYESVFRNAITKEVMTR